MRAARALLSPGRMRTILLVGLAALPALPAVAAEPIDRARLGQLLGFSGRAEAASLPELSPSPLPVRLLGTLRSRDGYSLAAVEWSARSFTLAIGDTLADAELVEIEQRALLFRRGGRLERVASLTTNSAPAGAPAHSVPRQLIDWAISNPQDVLSSAHLVPAFVNGKAVGFRALRVRPGSVAAQLGLEVGDVITAVDGTPLQSLKAVMGLADRLPTSRQVEVSFERGGRTLQKTFVLGP